jgi:hypothetical protein
VSSGQGSVATQLFFDEATTASIVATVPAYAARGAPDTDHASDLLASEPEPQRFLFRSRAVQGALVADKTIGVSRQSRC